MKCKGCEAPLAGEMIRVEAEEVQHFGEYPYHARVVTVDAGVFCGWTCVAIYALTRNPHDGDAIHQAGKIDLGREMRAAGHATADPDEEPF